MRTRIISLLLIIVALTACIASAENWPQWRGPHFDGSTSAAGAPAALDQTGPMAWSVDLPGAGNGTPVVWENRIFLSCVEKDSKKLLALCLDRKNGKELWKKEIGVGFKDNGRNNMASPSAITDGKRVFFYYGTGDLAAFDVEGNPLWARNLQKDFGSFNVMWIYASSPLLYKDKLYVQVLHSDRSYDGQGSGPAQSYLLGVNPQTGKDLFRQVRPTDAPGESKESYATPYPFEDNGKTQIVLLGGDAVTAHDPETGIEIWRVSGLNPSHFQDRRTVTSAVGGGGMVFACTPKGGPIYAIRGGGQGDVTATHIAWKSPDKEITSDVCVPLYYNDQLYILDGDRKTLLRVDPKTGEKKASVRLGGNPVFRASPTAADNRIYCINENGDAWIVSADELKILNKASLGGPTRASIVLLDGQALLRAGNKLYSR